MPIVLLILMLLAACAGPQHPLTYVHPGDPLWAINPSPTTAPEPATVSVPLDPRIKFGPTEQRS